MTFDPTRRNTKFGLLALDDCIQVQFQQTVDVSADVSIHPTCPIAIPAHWIEWLGTLETGHLADANLVIAIQIPSTTPTILNAETHTLHSALMGHLYGLLLHGIPDYRGGVIALGGIGPNGELDVKQVGRVPMAYRHVFGARPVITHDVLIASKQRADAILDLHKQTTHRRVRAGFRACLRGIEESAGEERVHQYVRAIDGLMHIPPGPGMETFATRGQTFAQGTDATTTLRQLYRLRNAQEHLNDFHGALDNPADNATLERLGSCRAYQAEQAALACYRRLFETPALLARFDTDAHTDAFWALDAPARQALWGAAFDLDATQADHDQRYALLHGLV